MIDDLRLEINVLLNNNIGNLKWIIILHIFGHFARFEGGWLSRSDRWLLGGILTKHKYNKRQPLAIQNFIECEAHRKLVLAGSKSKEDE